MKSSIAASTSRSGSVRKHREEGDHRRTTLVVRHPSLEARIIGELDAVDGDLPVDALQPLLLQVGEERVLFGDGGRPRIDAEQFGDASPMR